MSLDSVGLEGNDEVEASESSVEVELFGRLGWVSSVEIGWRMRWLMITDSVLFDELTGTEKSVSHHRSRLPS